MLDLFNSIITQVLLKNIHSVIKQDEINIWDKNLEGMIHIVEYPEHRMSVARIIKATFENFELPLITNHEKAAYYALKKLFLQYSNFFADFYSFRGTH